MKKRWLCILAVLCLLCGLMVGCGTETPEEGADLNPDEIGTDVELIHVDLSTVFSNEEMSEILDVTVVGNTVFEDGTSVSYQDAENSTVAIIALQEVAREVFDAMVADYPNAEQTPNLGEVAYWDSVGELLVFDSGYAVSVHIDLVDLTDTTRLTLSRHLAALVFERAFA